MKELQYKGNAFARLRDWSESGKNARHACWCYLCDVPFKFFVPIPLNPLGESPSKLRHHASLSLLDRRTFSFICEYKSAKVLFKIDCSAYFSEASLSVTSSRTLMIFTWSKFLVEHLTTLPTMSTSLSSIIQLSALDTIPLGTHFGIAPRLRISRVVMRVP